MSEHSNENIPPSEMKQLLACEPFYIQRLGMVATNAGLAEQFEQMMENGLDVKAIHSGLLLELSSKGLTIADVDDLLSLFEIPSIYD